jgi:hypothetical protein
MPNNIKEALIMFSNALVHYPLGNGMTTLKSKLGLKNKINFNLEPKLL